MVGKSFVQDGFVDDLIVVVLLGCEGDNIFRVGISAHGDGVINKTFAPVRSSAEKNCGVSIFACREIFKQSCRVELGGEFFSVTFKRKIFYALRQTFGNFYAGHVGIIEITPATIFNDVLRKVQAN